MDTRSWTHFTPSLEDFTQTVVNIPVRRNRLSVLERYGGNVAEFCQKTRYHLFGSTSVSLNFTGGFSSGKTHTSDCCFVSGSYWYTQVSSPVTMSQTRGDLPSNFLTMWVHQSILSRFCSSLRLWGTQLVQRFLTPRQS